jgi:2-iminoacetate synthase
VKKGNGAIRRVNINAAPLDVEGFRIVKEAGIGTYQIFQETYHPEAYSWYHPANTIKGNYEWRLTSMDRAQQAGIDDNGLGILFGLYDWRFEVMAMIRHTNHLEACFNVGPHTISFPRIKDASGLNIDTKYFVDDDTFEKIIAIFRLAVPYTGMILTARETAEFRAKAIQYGISQIDGGTNLQIGDYKYHHEEMEKNSDKQEDQNLHREQFKIGDDRNLGEIIEELLDGNYIPSFCTACYRLGRTGEHFMEFSVPGFIKRYCTPNAILTLSEYLVDYATPEVAAKGWKVIENNLVNVDEKFRDELLKRIERIKAGERDLYF